MQIEGFLLDVYSVLLILFRRLGENIVQTHFFKQNVVRNVFIKRRNNIFIVSWTNGRWNIGWTINNVARKSKVSTGSINVSSVLQSNSYVYKGLMWPWPRTFTKHVPGGTMRKNKGMLTLSLRPFGSSPPKYCHWTETCARNTHSVHGCCIYVFPPLK